MAGEGARLPRVLYVSYDGMTDPLGQSQVIPYVLGLTARGYDFHLLSFEKPARFAKEGDGVRRLLTERGVRWTPLRFTTRPRMVAKAYDRWRLRRTVRLLHREHHFDMLHCRSYPAADAGLALSKQAGVPYLFDMRGFWVDERVEGGIWNTRLPHYAALYRYFKRRERAYLAAAGGVVALTRAALDEMARWDGLPDLLTKVIPCSVDTELFRTAGDADARARTREELSLPPSSVVVGYLGSVSTWYMLDEMLQLFARILDRHMDARFLFITRHEVGALRKAAAEHGIPPDRIVAREATRDDVPRFLDALDVSVFFIRPSYSKMASCPTKLGELMAMGVPFITNAGVGDVDRIAAGHGASRVLADLSGQSLTEAADGLDDLLASSRESLVRAASEHFSLRGAIDGYAEMYASILSGRRTP